jgi:hypothetical protein
MSYRWHSFLSLVLTCFQGSREQLAIAEFASALLSIPKTLAVNAAKDSTELVAKLRSYHNAAQNAPVGDPKKALLRYGLDLLNGEVRDNVTAGVLEPTMSKVKSLKSAYEAAVSLLRIDDAIQCVPGTSSLNARLGNCHLMSTLKQSNRVSLTLTVIRSLAYDVVTSGLPSWCGKYNDSFQISASLFVRKHKLTKAKT